MCLDFPAFILLSCLFIVKKIVLILIYLKYNYLHTYCTNSLPCMCVLIFSTFLKVLSDAEEEIKAAQEGCKETLKIIEERE